jgi:ferrous iron transport protein B
VAGYKTVVSNFPGTTVEYVSSRVCLNGESFELVDLPGIYSLSTPEKEERFTRDYLLKKKPDLVVNIVDSSVLSRSLELTLELLELRLPLVVSLNMIDEAKRKGIEIDVEHLSQDLGVPVIPTIAIRGEGVPELFQKAIAAAQEGRIGKTFFLSMDVERTVSRLSSLLEKETADSLGVPMRLLALKVLEQDEEFYAAIEKETPQVIPEVEHLRRDLSECHGRPSDMVISSERHSLAMNLFEHVAKVRRRREKTFRDQVDKYLMHPFLGYIILGLMLISFFGFVFSLGKQIEAPLLGWFEALSAYFASLMDKGSLIFTLLNGLVQGFSAHRHRAALPYPFLLGCLCLKISVIFPGRLFSWTPSCITSAPRKVDHPLCPSYGCNVPAILGGSSRRHGIGSSLQFSPPSSLVQLGLPSFSRSSHSISGRFMPFCSISSM